MVPVAVVGDTDAGRAFSLFCCLKRAVAKFAARWVAGTLRLSAPLRAGVVSEAEEDRARQLFHSVVDFDVVGVRPSCLFVRVVLVRTMAKKTNEK